MVKELGVAVLLALRRLRGRVLLLAGLMALGVLLARGAGEISSALLLGESGASRLTLGIAGAEEDEAETRQLTALALSVGGVEDYCRLVHLSEAEGRTKLAEGELTALLLLPEGFLNSVLTGENKPVTLLTRGDQPLESWLVGRMGEAVSRMLAAAQAGIYTVMGEYDRSDLTEPPRQDLLWKVNLAYLGWVGGRERVYDQITLNVSGGNLPLEEHYILSVLAYLPLLWAALLFPALGGGELSGWYRRLRSAGGRPELGGAGGALACALVLLPCLFLSLLALGGEGLPALLGAALAALWSGAFCGFCIAAAGTPGGSGLLTFGLGTGMLFLSGGILPAALLPKGLRALGGWMPLTWAREVLGWGLGYEPSGGGPVKLLLLSVLLLVLTGLLFGARTRGEEGNI